MRPLSGRVCEISRMPGRSINPVMSHSKNAIIDIQPIVSLPASMPFYNKVINPNNTILHVRKQGRFEKNRLGIDNQRQQYSQPHASKRDPFKHFFGTQIGSEGHSRVLCSFLTKKKLLIKLSHKYLIRMVFMCVCVCPGLGIWSSGLEARN